MFCMGWGGAAPQPPLIRKASIYYSIIIIRNIIRALILILTMCSMIIIIIVSIMTLIITIAMLEKHPRTLTQHQALAWNIHTLFAENGALVRGASSHFASEPARTLPSTPALAWSLLESRFFCCLRWGKRGSVFFGCFFFFFLLCCAVHFFCVFGRRRVFFAVWAGR